MALNNLRIIYNNLIDLPTTTITASSSQASNPVSNLKVEQKSRTWRSSPTGTSTTVVRAYLLVDLGAANTYQVGGLVLAFTNLVTTGVTLTATGYSSPPSFSGTVDNPSVTGGSSTGNLGTTSTGAPWNTLALPNWGNVSNLAAYGKSTYARVWFNNVTPPRYILITIQETRASGVAHFIEVGKVILGPRWSPTHNTSFGLSAGFKDLSSHERTEAGDLVTSRAPYFSTLTFDLKHLTLTDRLEMSRLCLGGGISRPILVSLFPDNSANWEVERAHMLYGKFSQLPGVNYFAPDLFSTQLELEEI